MRYSPPEKKMKMREIIESSGTQLTDLDRSDMESSHTEFNYMESRESKSPAIARDHECFLNGLRELCDFCMVPPDDDDDDDEGELVGAVITVLNADKRDDLRDLAESALKFYNDTKLKNFKLVKVCKINIGCTYFALTFRAQEDGREECPLFRGAVHWVGGDKPVFCEIKDDDEVTLLPSDDDYVSSERS